MIPRGNERATSMAAAREALSLPCTCGNVVVLPAGMNGTPLGSTTNQLPPRIVTATGVYSCTMMTSVCGQPVTDATRGNFSSRAFTSPTSTRASGVPMGTSAFCKMSDTFTTDAPRTEIVFTAST